MRTRNENGFGTLSYDTYMSGMTKSCLLNRGWQVVIILMQYIVHWTRMAGIKCQMQVLNDDKGWIQLQQLSPSQVGDHTAVFSLQKSPWESAGQYTQLKYINNKYWI